MPRGLPSVGVNGRNATVRAPEDEVVDLVSALIRFDTSNTGELDTTRGEAECAEWVAGQLREVGYSPEYLESGAPGRGNVFARLPGADPTRGALLIHGHLDVVPAEAADWSVHPFSGAVSDGYVWGRGAVDMKDMDAMILAVLRGWGREGIRPRRDIVILLLPDEEAGGRHGAHWLTANRPEIFTGVTEAVGEVGGFSITVRDDLRLYPIQTAEKGMRWMRLQASGRAGHGSMIHDDNAITRLCEAVIRVGNYEWPERRTATVDRFLGELSDAFGVDLAAHDNEELVRKLGTLGLLVGATLRNTANPTMLEAGYKHNVIPGEAYAAIDGRTIPGFEEEFERTIHELVGPDITIERVVDDIAVEAPFDTLSVDLMASALRAEDPGARTVPYMISGGTDAKAFHRLGIACYGFAPLQMPAGLDYWRLFHGVDERVPLDGLTFGVRVLDRFLRAV
jgi:acetylornithine deacetylase/succinyl-diaminopimelate desuccinylase-like protein